MSKDNRVLLTIKNLTVKGVRYSRGLHKKETTLLKNINLDLKAGKITSLIGASGAGKTTLARAVAEELLPDTYISEGEIKNYSAHKPGYIPQSTLALNPLVKVMKQVEKSNRKNFLQTQRELGLSQYVNDLYPHELSGGMAKKVLAATLSTGNTNIIITDEISPGMDESSLLDLSKMFQYFSQQGYGVFMITHDLVLASELSDYMIVMNDGEIEEKINVKDFQDGKAQSQYTESLRLSLPKNNFIKKTVSFPSEEIIMQITGIDYAYNKRSILNNAFFQLKRNEIVGIFGASGKGKSTFAQLIAGHLSLQKGEIILQGNSVQMIWQHSEEAVNPEWTIRKILQEAGAIDSSVLSMFEVRKEWMELYPFELSGGELQRVCIARAVLAAPSILIADEITSMLDSLSQARIWDHLLKFVTKEKISLIIISHDRTLLHRICDRVVNFESLSFNNNFLRTE